MFFVHEFDEMMRGWDMELHLFPDNLQEHDPIGEVYRGPVASIEQKPGDNPTLWVVKTEWTGFMSLASVHYPRFKENSKHEFELPIGPIVPPPTDSLGRYMFNIKDGTSKRDHLVVFFPPERSKLSRAKLLPME